MWPWVGFTWARYFALSLPTAAAAAGAGEAPVARAGSFACFRGVLETQRGRPKRWRGLPGPRSQPLAGPPRSPLQPRQPRRCARFLRRGYPPCRQLAGGRDRGRSVARWGCGLRFPRVWGPLSGRGDGGAGAGPAVVAVVPLGGAIGVCHHCYPGRHAWSQVRPSHYLPVHQCRAVGSAVRCSAGGRGGGDGGPAVASAPYGRGPAAIHRHWEGRRRSHAAHASRHSSQSGAGLRALGPQGSSGGAGGSRTRWTPVTAVTCCVCRKVCTPSRAAGAGRGGRGTGAAP